MPDTCLANVVLPAPVTPSRAIRISGLGLSGLGFLVGGIYPRVSAWSLVRDSSPRAEFIYREGRVRRGLGNKEKTRREEAGAGLPSIARSIVLHLAFPARLPSTPFFSSHELVQARSWPAGQVGLVPVVVGRRRVAPKVRVNPKMETLHCLHEGSQGTNEPRELTRRKVKSNECVVGPQHDLAPPN